MLDSNLTDFNTTRNIIHIKLSSQRISNKLQEQEDLVEAAVVQAMVEDTHMEAKEAKEDGDSSQEEVDEVTPRMGLAVLDSPVPLAARADQAAQEDLEEEAAAVEDQATLRDLELCQT